MKTLLTLPLALIIPPVTAVPRLWALFGQRQIEDSPPNPGSVPLSSIPTGLYTNHPSHIAYSHPTNTAYKWTYPTATGTVIATGTASATGNPQTANHTSLSITLNYQTTLLTTQTISVSISSAPTAPPRSPSLGQQCSPGQIVCNSATTFSLCIGSTLDADTGWFFFMGAVADGYACTDEGILTWDGQGCTPSGELMCSDDDPRDQGDYSTFFLCEEGMFVSV
ncbi:hypothetical protein N7G274_001310 [Stereocaulon virgatum]|uniref:Uncharacterized protein n=1 Tax=Stereocaulon virgatum TaxID=373712 RepID=A0ABR4APA6_9LECA